jgi:AraC-like DNA-binding protein
MVVARIESVADSLIPTADGPSAYLMDKALSYVDRNYARELSDIDIAGLVGLSTSHFRFLFRQSTGQPVPRYLASLRPDMAKQLLNEGGLTVSDAAKAVGFTGLAHFSRAFHSRFKMSPTSAKRQGT